MIVTLGKNVIGKLKKLKHNYEESIFQYSELWIDQDENPKDQLFYGYVPESFLGKDVVLGSTKRELNLCQTLKIFGKKNGLEVRALRKNHFIE
ncbi:MAG: hypothetical protein ABIB79_01420 [archaeon]